MTPEKREDFINEDPATKSSEQAVAELQRIVKSTKLFNEVNAHLSDDFMNLIDVAAAQSKGQEMNLFGILLMNKHCYLATPFADSQTSDNDANLLRRTVELKQDILTTLFGWSLLVLDEADFLKQSTYEDRRKYVIERMGLGKNQSAISPTKDQG